MPVTLKDIAERVGKSVPTVSRALGNHADISPETRAEVQRVASELGYEPSATALNLKTAYEHDFPDPAGARAASLL